MRQEIPPEVNNLSQQPRRRFLQGLGIFFLSSVVASEVVARGIYTLAGVEISRSNDLMDRSKSEYYPQPVIQVHGGEFNLIGVRHNAQTFFQNQDDIRERVRNSPFVFLEYFNELENKLALPDIPDEQIFRFNEYNDAPSAFFAGVGKICAEEGKDIVVVNPETKRAQKIEFYLIFGIPIGNIFSELDEKFADLVFQLNTSQKRREVLKYLFISPSALTLASWLHDNRTSRSSLIDWSLIDWRNLNSAKGILKVKEAYEHEWNGESHGAVMFQGARHNSMIEYLEDDRLREAKSLLYPQFRFAGDYVAKRYRYDPAIKKWRLLRILSY